MIPKRPHTGEDNVDSWLMSYADMITLLMAFFVVFVATSEPKHERLVAATNGMREQFGVVSFETPYDGMYKSLIGSVASHKADRTIGVSKTANAVEIELAALTFFRPGGVEITEAGQPALQDIAAIVGKGALREYNVVVEAHSSPATQPISAYASSWDLTAARAAVVVRLLVAEGLDAKRLSARGLADTQPLLPNTDAKGNAIAENEAKNERVVIWVEKP